MDGIQSTLQNLVSALGGRDLSEPGSPYILGDDALGCLRDIKRWLQHYDERKDVWDVKSILGSMNFVANDLCPILASWTATQMEDEHKRRICLACVEILVPITWPLELGLDADDFKVKQLPNLRLAQTGYKRSMLFDPENDILSSVMRVAYPSLAISRRDRTERDTGIIKLVLYLLRNLAAIDENAHRSDTILAFAKANVLEFLCVVASGMGSEFTSEDVILLDVIYYLIRGVRVTSMFEVSAAPDSLKSELADLLVREKELRTNNRKQAHTRHNRFGTMISVVQDSRRFTVSSQTAILRNIPGSNFAGIEASKKWTRPQRQIKTNDDIDQKVTLNTEARLAIASFITTFLDAGFNPLFQCLLKALEQDDARVSEANRIQFLYMQAWCFSALREKGQSSHRKGHQGSDFADDAEYSLVASMMESRATIMLRKMLRESIEAKIWREAHAAMICLKELLLTINAMSLSSEAEYQDIAENLQSNLYYEESNLELVATCVRTYTTQSLGYLDACTDLATVLLRMLEKYASTKTHMFVRARRTRQKRKKNAITQAPTPDGSDNEDAEAEAREAVKERAFSFAKFEGKFVNEHAINTFMSFLQYYADLTGDQIKRIITFFHRIFVRLKTEILLYRVELFELLHRMINDKTGFLSTNPARVEVQTFTIYLMKRFSRTIGNCPALAWEILFEKLSTESYYLTHEQNKAPAERKAPRPPAEFDMKPGLTHPEEIRVLVGILMDENKTEALNWLKDALQTVVTQRYAWEAAQQARAAENTDSTTPIASRPSAEALRPEAEQLKLQLFKDGKLRLLLKLLKLERVGNRADLEALWIVPADLETDELHSDLQLIKEYTLEAPQMAEGKTAMDYIKRQVAPRVSYASSDDSFSSSSTSDDEDVSRVKKKRVQTIKSKSRAQREVAQEELDNRTRAREEKEQERKNQIKSAKYVNDSDDEDDEAANAIFFAAEAALRERQKLKAAGIMTSDTNSKRKPSQIGGSSDKENQAIELLQADGMDSSTMGSRHSVSPGYRKRISNGAAKHGNALFVQDDSEGESDTLRPTKQMKRNVVEIDSDDD